MTIIAFLHLHLAFFSSSQCQPIGFNIYKTILDMGMERWNKRTLEKLERPPRL